MLCHQPVGKYFFDHSIRLIRSEMTNSSTLKVLTRIFNKQALIFLIKASWRRWPILMLWLLYATNNAFQFLEFTSVMGPIVQFYQVTEDQVLWMSGVTFISQGAGALPVAFMAEILTLRTSGIFNYQYIFINRFFSNNRTCHNNCRLCYEKCCRTK